MEAGILHPSLHQYGAAVVVLDPEVELAPVYPDEVREVMLTRQYSEARTWLEWIRVMTIADLAEEMWVSHDEAAALMNAALWHGIICDTDDVDEGNVIYEYVPIPPGPTHHFTHQPEWQNRAIGCGELAPRNRGMPVRIRTEREMRKIMSTSGGAGIHKRREQAYNRMQEAVRKRQAAQAKKEGEEEKWRKVKKKSVVV